MVLQENKPVPVWGKASEGETVSVKFNDQLKTTTADLSGNWKLMLDPMNASDVPSEMIIKGKNTIILKNILVGEVWICSGQSNMEYSMRKNNKISPRTNKFKTPESLLPQNDKNIRLFLVNRKFMNPDSTHRGWSDVSDSSLESFSAIGFFFAKILNQQLHVPIGIISSAIPGSRIEPWISADYITKSEYLKKDSSKNNGDIGKFYNTMIKPLAPFVFKGFLWYQGESNCFLNDTIQYAYKFQTLINNWRDLWQDPTLPFCFVQIAPYQYSHTHDKVVLTTETLPKFHEAQTLALQIPYTGMVETSDLIDSISELHPPYKSQIAWRLSLWALAKCYDKNVVYSGPLYKSMKIKGNQIELEFNYCGSGLISNNGKPLNCFTIAGSDNKFVPAEAVIKENKVIVSAKGLKHPVNVRFGWNEADLPNLFNKEGLPAASFRTDNAISSLFHPE